MAKTQLQPQILAISGAIGNMIFRTYTKPDGTKETRVYRNPYFKQNGRSSCERKTPVSDKERAARSRFSLMAKAVNDRIKAGDQRPRSEIWQDVKQQFQLSNQ